MTTAVHRKHEISLFGEFYPIIGEVNSLVASQLAEKTVTGDFSKESDRLRSSWIISDQRGGVGVKDMEERIHGDRVYWSTSHINTKGHLTLPVLVTDATNPTVFDPLVMIEYQNELYAVFGTDLRRRIEGSNAWSATLGTLVDFPTDAIVHKSKLYFACGSDFNRYDGTTLTTGAALGSAQPSRYFVDWVDNLYNLDNDGQMDYSTDEGVTWITDAVSTLPSGHFTSLEKYHNGSSPPAVIIYLGTKEGLKQHNNGATAWEDTELPLPFHDFACAGMAWWREWFFVSSGMQVYQYQTTNQGATIFPMGLSRDDGVPQEFSGNIIKLLAGHNYLYALVDATVEVDRDLYGGEGNGGLGDATIVTDTGFSVVYKWDGFGWSVVHAGEEEGSAINTGVLATADDLYRIWFGIDNTVKFAPLSVTLENPVEVSTSTFAFTSINRTGWFDDSESVETKLGAEVSGYYTDMTEDEYIELYYSVDYDDDTWRLLTSDDFPDGKIDQNGQASFVFADGAGIAFKAIRFEERLFRGSTNTKSPDRRWVRLSFLPILEVKFGFNVRVDCTKNYRRRNKKQMTKALKTALRSQTMGVFQFRDGNSTETHRVRIADIPGAEIGGKKHEGIFDVQLVAP